MSFFPLIICNAISCPLCKLKTIEAIKMKLHTVVKHNKTMRHKNHNSALDILELFPFDYIAMLFIFRYVS